MGYYRFDRTKMLICFHEITESTAQIVTWVQQHDLPFKYMSPSSSCIPFLLQGLETGL